MTCLQKNHAPLFASPERCAQCPVSLRQRGRQVWLHLWFLASANQPQLMVHDCGAQLPAWLDLLQTVSTVLGRALETSTEVTAKRKCLLMTVVVRFTRQQLTATTWLVVGFPLAWCLFSDSFGAEMQLPMIK